MHFLEYLQSKIPDEYKILQGIIRFAKALTKRCLGIRAEVDRYGQLRYRSISGHVIFDGLVLLILAVITFYCLWTQDVPMPPPTHAEHFRTVRTLADGSKEVVDSCGHIASCQITLPDDSKVSLCFNSSLRYRVGFDSLLRAVTLDGQAAFEVTSDKIRPFVVHTGHVMIQALGTYFNVTAYRDEPFTVITLLSGGVEITSGRNKKLLHPGEQTVITGNHVTIRMPDSPERVLSWINRDPHLDFENTDLETVMLRLGRWYKMKVSNPDHVRGTPIRGSIRMNSPLDSNLDLLKNVERCCACLKRRGDTIIISNIRP